jgi:antitoxin (DNA-binding transcriptional repressor) of toxin-antitoxin stability system
VKSVKLTDVTGSLSECAQKGLREAVVVTKRGRPVMAVMPLPRNDDWESVSISMNPKFIEIIERSRASAREKGCIPLAEVRRRHGTKPNARRRPKTR